MDSFIWPQIDSSKPVIKTKSLQTSFHLKKSLFSVHISTPSWKLTFNLNFGGYAQALAGSFAVGKMCNNLDTTLSNTFFLFVSFPPEISVHLSFYFFPMTSLQGQKDWNSHSSSIVPAPLIYSMIPK